MCFSPEATPPPLPSGKALVRGDDITLRSADGASIAAFEAHAQIPSGAAVVVLPDVRGLYGFYKNLASSFAAESIDAIAIDYFARSDAGTDRSDDFDPWPHVQATDVDTVQADLQAAVLQLRELEHVERIYTVGFCFGGGHSFSAAAFDHGLAGVVGFYGKPYAENQFYPSAIELTDRMECPVLGLFGGADNSISADIIGQFDAELGASKIEHELHTYDGAPHSFFDRSSAEWADACQDSWQRMLTFIK